MKSSRGCPHSRSISVLHRGPDVASITVLLLLGIALIRFSPWLRRRPSSISGPGLRPFSSPGFAGQIQTLYWRPTNSDREIHDRSPRRRHRIRTAESLAAGRRVGREVREDQSADGRGDARQGAAGGQASASALFAGHAERGQGHGAVRGIARPRVWRCGVRRLADRYQRGRAVRFGLCRDQPEFEDSRDGRPQRRSAAAGFRVRGHPAVPGRKVRRLPATRPPRAASA